MSHTGRHPPVKSVPLQLPLPDVDRVDVTEGRDAIRLMVG